MKKDLIKIVTENEAQVVTHSGVFHADDVLATVILAKLFQQRNQNDAPLKVCREFKVSAELPEDVIVYDIGGGKFDHHQKGGNGARENGVPYSSAGLIWREFGKELLKNTSDPDVIWERVDRELIQAIDASDNGTMPKVDFPCLGFSLSHAISGFNPTWDSTESFEVAFVKAVAFMEEVFDAVVMAAVGEVSKRFEDTLSPKFKTAHLLELVIMRRIFKERRCVMEGERYQNLLKRKCIRENGVPYSFVGLLWKEYGKEFLKDTGNPESIWEALEKGLIQPIDAADSGVMPEVDYPVQPLSIAKAIEWLNPVTFRIFDTEEFSLSFERAVELMRAVFDNAVATAAAKAKAESLVNEALRNSKGHVLVLDRYMPWQEPLLTSENEAAKDILFVVYPAVRGGYNWQCVPDAIGSFGQRRPVPQEWKGAPADELQKLTGVEGFTFCHPAGFLGACKTQDEAIRVATLAAEA